MEKFKTVIIGFGRHGSGLQADGITGNRAFDLVAVCDIEPSRLEFAAAKLQCRTYRDYRAMVRQEQPDLAVIATRSDQHCEMTCACLKAGVNVMVTKPWALNLAEAKKIMRAASHEKAGRIIPWLPSFWGCDVRRIRELLAQNVIGEVFNVRLVITDFSVRSDWQTMKKYGGGYLLNWGPHLVLKAVLAAGGLENVKSVYARMLRAINPGDTEDVFNAMMVMKNGTIVQVERTIAPLERSWWAVQGRNGMINVQDNELTIIRASPSNPNDPTSVNKETIISAPAKETLDGNLYGDNHEIYVALAKHLKGEEALPVTAADAMRLTAILDAVRKAAETNRVINLK